MRSHLQLHHNVDYAIKYKFYIKLTIIFCFFVWPEERIAPGRQMLFGVNDVKLYMQSDFERKEKIDIMAENGIRYLRVALRTNDGSIPSIINYAKNVGIRVLVVLPSGVQAFYRPHVSRRPDNRFYWSTFPISEIDLTLFSKFWDKHRDQMRTLNVEAFGYQIGNEINGPGFNGDFPVGPGGYISSADRCSFDGLCEKIYLGFQKYVELLKIVRSSLKTESVQVLAAGMASVSAEWARSSNGFFFSPSATIKRFNSLGIDKYVDAYSIHQYLDGGKMNVNEAAELVSKKVNSAARQCAVVPGKKCWITEWGIRSARTGCEMEIRRDKLLEAAIREIRKQEIFQAAFYFDWDKDAHLSIFRCGVFVSSSARIMWPRQ